MNWLHYLLEANIYLSVFYAFYCLFLTQETHYMLNRVYLLFSCVVSFIIPLMQIGALKHTEPVSQQVFVLPNTTVNVATNIIPLQPVVTAQHFTLQDGIWYAYLLGVGVLLAWLAVKLYQLMRLSKVKPVYHNGYKLIYIDGSNTAFSFFNYLFISTNAPETEIIIRHELVHIRQKHSVDIILLELFKIINWFNPVIYLLQNSLKTIHEYIADEQTAAYETDAISYSSFLVNNAYGIGGSPIANSFFNYKLLKKRIIMLHQQRSDKLARLKYLMAVPLCAALLCASTLAFSKTYGWVDLVPKKASLTIDVNFKHKRKTLKFIQGDVVGYGDSISIPDKKNKKIIYTVNDLTEAKKEFALKNNGIKLEVVETISKPGKVLLTFPVFKANTDIHHIKDVESVTPKGYKYKEAGYLINNKADFRVIITDKKGNEKDFFKNSCTPAELKLLKDKYGYTFPNMPIYLKLPPPPPVAANDIPAPGGPAKRLPPPPPAPPKEGTFSQEFMKKRPLLIVDNQRYVLKEPLKATQSLSYTAEDSVVFINPGDATAKAKWGNDANNGVIMLYGKPSVKVVDDFSKFYEQLSKTIHYPAVDRQNKIMGKVFASFTVDADGKIQDVKILRGPSKTLNDEMLKVLNNIGTLKGASPGITYNIPVNFYLSGYTGPATLGKTETSTGGDSNKSDKQVYLSEVVVTGYI